MMNKSGQGLSMNAMVIGGLAIVVLFVIIGLFTGYFGKVAPDFETGGEQECRGLGYKQMPEGCGELGTDPLRYLYTRYYGSFKEGSLKDNMVCCRSSCEAANGQCQKQPYSKTRLHQGDSGCPSERVCYSK